METLRISKQVSELSAVCAYISLASIVAFLLLLILLHLLKPGLSPAWHMVSEYAIGPFGWMMQLAFACLALSCLSIAVASWPLVPTTGGKMGAALLLTACIGLSIAAVNNTDPINTPKLEMSPQGNRHGLGFMIGVPSLTVACLLISMSLRNSLNWTKARPLLLWSAQLPWISIILMLAIIFIFLPKNDGKFGPAVFVGLPNRLWVLACCTWIVIVACGMIRQQKEQSLVPVPGNYCNE